MAPPRKTRSVRGRGRLAVAEQGGDDNEVVVGVEAAARVVWGGNEPLVALDNGARVPGWVDDAGLRGGAVGSVGNVGGGEDLAGLEHKVVKLEVLDFGSGPYGHLF